MSTVESLVPKVITYLTVKASETRVVFYKDVAENTGTHQRVVPKVLGVIRGLCEEYGWPALTSIVVNQSTGEPGEAFLDPWLARDAPLPAKRAMWRQKKDETFAFDWTAVRERYGEKTA